MLISILLIVLLGVAIFVIPYFIPNTPKFTLRKYYQAISSNDELELSKCSIFNYNAEDSITNPKEYLYLLFSKKINLSQEELEEDLYLVKEIDREKFDYLETTDIVKHEVIVYTDSTILPQPQPTVILIRNKFDNNKYKWLIVP